MYEVSDMSSAIVFCLFSIFTSYMYVSRRGDFSHSIRVPVRRGSLSGLVEPSKILI